MLSLVPEINAIIQKLTIYCDMLEIFMLYMASPTGSTLHLPLLCTNSLALRQVMKSRVYAFNFEIAFCKLDR
jgi:hypothetical protein